MKIWPIDDKKRLYKGNRGSLIAREHLRNVGNNFNTKSGIWRRFIAKTGKMWEKEWSLKRMRYQRSAVSCVTKGWKSNESNLLTFFSKPHLYLWSPDVRICVNHSKWEFLGNWRWLGTQRVTTKWSWKLCKRTE